MATAASCGDWALPLSGHWSPFQFSRLHSQCGYAAAGNTLPYPPPSSLQTALIPHCTSATATFMAPPRTTGTAGTHPPSWVLQQQSLWSPVLCWNLGMLYLKDFWVLSATVCVCLNVYCETAFFFHVLFVCFNSSSENSSICREAGLREKSK